MLVVGLTGGIGSGKTTVTKIFNTLGVPVYISDLAARTLIDNDVELQKKIKEVFGQEVYTKGLLDRRKLANEVFSNPQKLNLLNAIVHPAVKLDFLSWLDSHSAPYVIKEAAILFESGSYKNCSRTIVVVAPENARIKRVVLRDNVPKETVKQRMANQWEDAKKIALANFVIYNDSDLNSLNHKVFQVHDELLTLAQESPKTRLKV